MGRETLAQLASKARSCNAESAENLAKSVESIHFSIYIYFFARKTKQKRHKKRAWFLFASLQSPDKDHQTYDTEYMLANRGGGGRHPGGTARSCGHETKRNMYNPPPSKTGQIERFVVPSPLYYTSCDIVLWYTCLLVQPLDVNVITVVGVPGEKVCDWLRWGGEGDKGGQTPLLKDTEEEQSLGTQKNDNTRTQDVRTSAALIDGTLVVVEVGEHTHSVEVVAGVFDDPLRTVLHQMLKQRQRLPNHVQIPVNDRITAIHTNEAVCQIVVIYRYLQ